MQMIAGERHTVDGKVKLLRVAGRLHAINCNRQQRLRHTHGSLSAIPNVAAVLVAQQVEERIIHQRLVIRRRLTSIQRTELPVPLSSTRLHDDHQNFNFLFRLR
jgi:altronate dehydratase